MWQYRMLFSFKCPVNENALSNAGKYSYYMKSWHRYSRILLILVFFFLSCLKKLSIDLSKVWRDIKLFLNNWLSKFVSLASHAHLVTTSNFWLPLTFSLAFVRMPLPEKLYTTNNLISVPVFRNTQPVFCYIPDPIATFSDLLPHLCHSPNLLSLEVLPWLKDNFKLLCSVLLQWTETVNSISNIIRQL